MGGIGSGRHRPNKKFLTTDCRKLDVLELNRAGALKPGKIGSMSWSDDEGSHVSFCCEPEALLITYHGHFFTDATDPLDKLLFDQTKVKFCNNWIVITNFV